MRIFLFSSVTMRTSLPHRREKYAIKFPPQSSKIKPGRYLARGLHAFDIKLGPVDPEPRPNTILMGGWLSLKEFDLTHHFTRGGVIRPADSGPGAGTALQPRHGGER